MLGKQLKKWMGKGVQQKREFDHGWRVLGRMLDNAEKQMKVARIIVI